MNLCAHGHAEVCFEERDCPVCEVRQQWKDETDDMVKDIKRLESENAELQTKIDKHEN